MELFVSHTAAATVYFSVWNAAGNVFDFDDDTFKAVGSATTPYVAATERTGPGGSDSYYTASLTLANLNKGGVPVRLAVTPYLQAGGSPAPATDTPLSDPQLVDVQFGDVCPPGGASLDLEIGLAFTTTAGTTLRILASLLRNGARVPLETLDAAATLALAVREHGAGADLFTITAVTVDAAHAFELSKSTPGYTADRVYRYTFTLSENGNTHVFVKNIPVHG